MIAVTCIYGAYDQPKPHVDHPAVSEWLCYTDNAELVADDWTVIYAPLNFANPRLNAKWWKTHLPLGDDGRVLWLDGSVIVIDPGYIDEVIRCLDLAPLAMFRHPDRDCIYDEAYVSSLMTKYIGHDVGAQVEFYRRIYGWPAHAGLWASTTFGARPGEIADFGAAWFSHNELLTYQDQLSLPVLLERYGITPEPIKGDLWRNDWFRLARHASDY